MCDSRYTSAYDPRYRSAYDPDAMLHHRHELLAGSLVRDCSLYRVTVMGRRLLNSNGGRGRWEIENLMARTVPGATERKNGLTERKNGLQTCSVRRANRLRVGAMSKLAGTRGSGVGMPWHALASMAGGAAIKSPMGFNIYL